MWRIAFVWGSFFCAVYICSLRFLISWPSYIHPTHGLVKHKMFFLQNQKKFLTITLASYIFAHNPNLLIGAYVTYRLPLKKPLCIASYWKGLQNGVLERDSGSCSKCFKPFYGQHDFHATRPAWCNMTVYQAGYSSKKCNLRFRLDGLFG